MLALTPWRMVKTELYTHAQPPSVKFGTGRSASVRAEVSRITGNGEGMVFVNNFVRALLSVCSQVAVGQVVAGQNLVSPDPARSKAVRGRRGSLLM